MHQTTKPTSILHLEDIPGTKVHPKSNHEVFDLVVIVSFFSVSHFWLIWWGISMVRKRSPSNKDIQQSKNDDLKLINGIGPAVENRLNDVGIYTYAQLAALSPADIAAAVAGLAGQSAERITKQDWIGQARSLTVELVSSEAQKYLEHATEQSALIEYTHATTPLIESQHIGEPESIQSETKKEAETPAETEQVAMFIAPVEPTPPLEDAHTKTLTAEAQKETETIMSKGQFHPATFMVELLLDENNIVHKARAMHVESQREHSWSNWLELELVDFLEKSAEVNVLPVEAVPAEPVPANSKELEHVPVLVAESTPLAEMPTLAGTLHLRDMKILGIGSPEPRS
ncbi:MAG TPA: helix-hairpin-helix domain-containing protein, partial [Ktedonobacteraceae bacterium]|nr:helix-hairpin-helix domain-containing protein [Ktedonobacteraceae bacterium]